MRPGLDKIGGAIFLAALGVSLVFPAVDLGQELPFAVRRAIGLGCMGAALAGIVLIVVGRVQRRRERAGGAVNPPR
ncbi:hypothetical protein K8I61_02585 [bacterium]|nr:hypothetical protein [bacterium]